MEISDCWRFFDFFPQNDASTYAKASSVVNTMEDKTVDKEVIESGLTRREITPHRIQASALHVLAKAASPATFVPLVPHVSPVPRKRLPRNSQIKPPAGAQESSRG